MLLFGVLLWLVHLQNVLLLSGACQAVLCESVPLFYVPFARRLLRGMARAPSEARGGKSEVQLCLPSL